MTDSDITGPASADTAVSILVAPALSTNGPAATDPAAVPKQPTPSDEGSGSGRGGEAGTYSKSLQAAQTAQAATSSSDAVPVKPTKTSIGIECIVSVVRVCEAWDHACLCLLLGGRAL
jgi:hypothetical protein